MNLGPMELVFVFLIVLLVFGAGKVPKLAKDIGSGIRVFRKSMAGDFEEEKAEKKDKKDESKVS